MPFDRYLVGYIRTGWLDLEGLWSAIQEVEANVGASASQDRLRIVLRAYGDNFNLDRDQYAARITEVLTEGLEHLTVFELDNGLETLSMLNQGNDELAQAYIQVRGDHLQKVAEAQGRNRDIVNPILNDEVSRREAEFQADRFTIDQVARDLTGDDGWSRSQIEYLAAQPVEAYVDWMLGSPPDLLHKIRVILDFRGQNEAPYPQMVATLEDALRVLARQSNFNATRIQSAYGVTLPDDEDAPDNADD